MAKRSKHFNRIVVTQSLALLLIMAGWCTTAITVISLGSISAAADRHGASLVAAIVSFFYIIYASFARMRRLKTGWASELKLAIIAIAFLILIIPVAVLLVEIAASLDSNKHRSLSRDIYSLPSKLVAAVFLSIFVFVLFKFRLRYRSCYGLTELLFSIYAGWSQITQIPQEKLGDLGIPHSLSFAPVLLTGCVYLAIRGLDNMHQGIEKDRLARWVVSNIRLILPRAWRAKRLSGGKAEVARGQP